MDEYDKRWLLEGHRISLIEDGKPERFFFIKKRERARHEYAWTKSIAPNGEDTTVQITDLEPQRLDVIYQVIFGVKTGVYVYVNLPLSTRIWGLDKTPTAKTTNRRIGEVTQDTSPYESPDFETELFLQRGGDFAYPALSVFNPTNRSLRPRIRFEVNKLQLKEITARDGEIFEKLRKGLLFYRPISLGPLPAARTGREVG